VNLRLVVFLLVAAWLCLPRARAAEVSRAKVEPTRLAFTMERLPARQLVMLFYDHCEKRGLVFDPSAQRLDDPLTIKTPSMGCSETRAVLLDALSRLGLSIEARAGFDVVKQSPLQDERDAWRQLIYRPRFRDALELAQLVRIAVRKGSFAHERQAQAVQLGQQGQAPLVPDTGSNGASITGKSVDKLVFFGPVQEVVAVESLLSRLDTPSPQVEIQAGVYEFQAGKQDGSAVNAAVRLFGSRLGVTVDGGAASGGTSLKLALPSIDAALTLLDQDTRFRYVARPKVLVRDGQEVLFTSGQDVRVDGQSVVNASGQIVTTKTTVTAGLTLQATPFVRGELVDLSLRQVVSDFVPSLNDQPSLVRRDLSTRLLMQRGYVYVIGGLQTNRKSSSHRGLFGFPIADSADVADTEVLLLLTVRDDQAPL
jgi:general secretion pathway protein D